MMQLLCNGTFLDLYEGSGLQFTHKNPLFAFDALECERTTSFKIPATPKNDRVLALAKLPALSGIAMRRKYDAELYDGAVVKRGYIYVSNFDGKDYNVIFVTGELVGLQALKNAGKIADILNPVGGLVWDAAHVQDANALGVYGSDVAIARYLTNATPCHPSFDLGGLMSLAYMTVTGRPAPEYTRGFRVIPKELQGMPKTACTLVYTGTDLEPSDDSFGDVPYANTLSATGFGAAVDTTEQILYLRVGGISGTSSWYNLRQWRALQSIILTFPDDFPDDLFLLSVKDTGADGSDPEYNPLSPDWFLGDYSFHTVGNSGTATTGTPLRGRSVEIPSGTPFIILSRDWYEYDSGFHWNGFRYLSEQNDGYTVEITAENNEISVGDTIRVQDILPDLTVTDLLKIHAYLTGTVLNYTDADGVTFDVLDFDTWERVDITPKKMTEDEVRRVFANYAQRNIIEFDSAADVLSNTRVRTEYTIDNDNLEETKTLATIPFNEGELAAADGFICPRFNAEDVEKNKLPKDGIYFATPHGGRYGQRVTLTPNAGLQALCDASTQIQVGARLTLLEYERITPKTLIYVDGTEYVWTSRNWQKNEAQFTLARLYEAGAAPVPPQPEYVQDGLVFWLDGEDIGNNSGYWTEKIGNRKFQIFGGVQHIDKAMVFDGTGYCQQDTLEQWQWFYNNATVCICMEFTGPTGRQYWALNPYNGTGTLHLPLIMRREDGVMYYRNDGQLGILLPSSPFTFAAGGFNGKYSVIMVLNKSTSINYGPSDFWGMNRNEPTLIGVRVSRDTSTSFIGRIMNIMVYNRILTEDEIMQNQEVDNIRFNLGL